MRRRRDDAIIALPSLVAAWRGDYLRTVPPGYYAVSTAARAEYALWYLGLAGLLGVLCYEVHAQLAPLRG